MIIIIQTKKNIITVQEENCFNLFKKGAQYRGKADRAKDEMKNNSVSRHFLPPSPHCTPN